MPIRDLSDIQVQNFFDACARRGIDRDEVHGEFSVNDLHGASQTVDEHNTRAINVGSIEELRALLHGCKDASTLGPGWMAVEGDWPVFSPDTQSMDGNSLTSDQLRDIGIAARQYVASDSSVLPAKSKDLINYLLFPMLLRVFTVEKLSLSDNSILTIGNPGDPPYVVVLGSLVMGDGAQIEVRAWTLVNVIASA